MRTSRCVKGLIPPVVYRSRDKMLMVGGDGRLQGVGTSSRLATTENAGTKACPCMRQSEVYFLLALTRPQSESGSMYNRGEGTGTARSLECINT